MLDLPYYINLAVGLLLFILGFIVVRLTPRDVRGVAFAIFLWLVGVNFVANHFAAAAAFILGDRSLVRTWTVIGDLVLILDPLALVYFASLYPRRRGFAERRVATLLLVATGVLFTLWAIIVYPDLDDVTYKLARESELVVCYAGALFALTRVWVTEPAGAERRTHGLLVVALSAMVLPRFAITVQEFVHFGLGLPQRDLSAIEAFAIVAVSGAMFVLLPALVRTRLPGDLWRDHMLSDNDGAAGSPMALPHDRGVLVVALALPVLFTLFWTELLAFGSGNPALLFSTRWIVFSLVGVYGLLQLRLIDLDFRVAYGATFAVALIVAALAFFLVREILVDLRPGMPDSVVVTASAALAVLVAPPAWVLARRGRDVIVPREATVREAYLARRRLEVYGAAVAYAVDEARDPDQDATVRALRQELRIGHRDHKQLVSLAQSEARIGHQPFAAFRMGAVIGRHYVVGAQIGGGRHGRTYRATDRRQRRSVVIKELRPEWGGEPGVRQRFEAEAELLRRVQHPHVVRCLDAFDVHRSLCLVLEDLVGGDLRARLNRSNGRLPEADAVQCVRGALSGLEALHAAGILHLDVKPENLLFDLRGLVKVADLGIAVMRPPDGGGGGGARVPGDDGTPVADETLLTGAASGAGTLAYMSPEQARGQPLDARADLYGAGAVLYECLDGRPPVDVRGLSDFDARRLIIDHGVRLDDFAGGAQWVPVLARALAHDPADRYPDAGAFRAAVLEVAAERLQSSG